MTQVQRFRCGFLAPFCSLTQNACPSFWYHSLETRDCKHLRGDTIFRRNSSSWGTSYLFSWRSLNPFSYTNFFFLSESNCSLKTDAKFSCRNTLQCFEFVTEVLSLSSCFTSGTDCDVLWTQNSSHRMYEMKPQRYCCAEITQNSKHVTE
jgi:hypothetical protein